MSELTVKQFADVVGIPVDRLLVQLGEAGLSDKDQNTTITDKEKVQLLSYLRGIHGSEEESAASPEPRKITLRRKSVGELRQTGTQGKKSVVNVEFRKRRTYVKRASITTEEPAVEEPPVAPEPQLELQTVVPEAATPEPKAAAEAAPATPQAELEPAPAEDKNAKQAAAAAPCGGARQGARGARQGKGQGSPCRTQDRRGGKETQAPRQGSGRGR